MFKWLNKIRLKGLPTDTDATTVVVVNDNGDLGKQRRAFYLQDGDGTQVNVALTSTTKFIEGDAGININWTDTSDGSASDPYDLTFYNTLYKTYHGHQKLWILPSDFSSTKGNLSYDSGGVIDNTADAIIYAHVLIPLGATATHVVIYSNSDAAAVVVYEKLPSAATETSRGTGVTGEQIDITDVASTDTGTHLAIKITPDDPDTDRFYGGLVSL